MTIDTHGLCSPCLLSISLSLKTKNSEFKHQMWLKRPSFELLRPVLLSQSVPDIFRGRVSQVVVTFVFGFSHPWRNYSEYVTDLKSQRKGGGMLCVFGVAEENTAD